MITNVRTRFGDPAPHALRSGRVLRHWARFGLVVVFASGCASAASGKAVGLRPGCQVVLDVPTTRMIVDASWLGPGTDPRWFRGGCPSEPLKVSDVYFGRAVLALLDIASGLGRNGMKLYVQDIPRSDNPFPSDREHDLRSFQPGTASVEMRRFSLQDTAVVRYPDLQYTRIYTVRYRASDGMAGRAGQNQLQRTSG